MKVFLAIKYHADLSNKKLIEQLSSILAAEGFEVVCVFRDIEQWGKIEIPGDELMRRTFEALGSCDLAIVESSEKGVGLGIEAGFAFAKGIPIVSIARRGSDVSETLRGISRRVLYYQNPEDLRKSFSQLGSLISEGHITNAMHADADKPRR